MKKTSYFETAIGSIGITTENGAVTEVFFCDNETDRVTVSEKTKIAKECAQQIMEYTEGNRREFNIPVAPKGTAFQKKIWDLLERIPYGETRTYGEIAREAGCVGGARAVGMANHQNPIAIIIPCHRVIGKNGKLTGYGGGIERKEKLLALEAVHKK